MTLADAAVGVLVRVEGLLCGGRITLKTGEGLLCGGRITSKTVEGLLC